MSPRSRWSHGACWGRSRRVGQLTCKAQTRHWAEQGATEPEPDQPTVDCNGHVLQDGDSVALVKDLDVKGTSFVAKRGTVVRKIRLTDDPRNIEGRVNKVALVLKTEFLKKVK